ncbi:unnamed protein product [Lampetra planeri]
MGLGLGKAIKSTLGKDFDLEIFRLEPPGQRTMPPQLAFLLSQPAAPRGLQVQHGFSSTDLSPSMSLKEGDALTVHRRQTRDTTDAARGRTAYRRGVHTWEITWPTEQRGTHAAVGVATSDAPLEATGYVALVGRGRESWGWDLGRCKAYHDAVDCPGRPYPAHLLPCESFHVPERVVMVLDMEEGTLSFVVDGEYLGVAFSGLRGKTLYPAVSAVWGNCEIKMRYINGIEPGPLPLDELCRRSIRNCLGNDRLEEINALALPTLIKRYLHYN